MIIGCILGYSYFFENDALTEFSFCLGICAILNIDYLDLPAMGAPNTTPTPMNTMDCPKPKLNHSGPATTRMHSFTVGDEAALKKPKMNEHTASPASEVNAVSININTPEIRKVAINLYCNKNAFQSIANCPFTTVHNSW